MKKVQTNFFDEDVWKVIAGIAFGFVVFLVTSHPHSPINKKIPHKKIRKFHFLPHVKIVVNNKTIHFHHWMNIASLYGFLLITQKKRFRSKIAHGFFIGGILQGLSYKDCLKIVY